MIHGCVLLDVRDVSVCRQIGSHARLEQRIFDIGNGYSSEFVNDLFRKFQPPFSNERALTVGQTPRDDLRSAPRVESR
jgi:hypothetical protein